MGTREGTTPPQLVVTSSALNAAPTVATPAAASPSPTTGTTTALSVLGADDGGESDLTYTWSTTSKPTGAANPTFSTNGTNASKNTIATFSHAGTYTFLASISDGTSTVTSSVNVTVDQAATNVVVTPSTATVAVGTTQAFSASEQDQFGQAMTSQPTFAWSIVSGAGSINSSGVYTAASASGTATVKAADSGNNSIGGTASITTTNQAPTVATAASANPTSVTGTTTSLSVLGADDGGESHLTYTWLATGPAAVTYSANATNAAKNTIATFTSTGTYNFTVTISDGSSSTTSTVSVVVTALHAASTGTFSNGGTVTEHTAGQVSFTNVSGTGPFTYEYDFNNDGTFNVTGAGATETVPVSYLDDNPSRTIRARIVDASGQESQDYFTTIPITNTPPTATINGPSSGISGLQLAFTSTVTDPSTADTTAGFIYAWSVTKDGAAYSQGTATNGASFAFTPSAAGSYVVSLAATDKDNGSSTTSANVSVTDGFGIVIPGAGAVGQPTTIQLHNLQPPTTSVASWTVNWGDGTTSTVTDAPISSTSSDIEWDVQHTYAAIGSYTVSATAVDLAGTQHNAGSATQVIKVPPPNVSPLVIPAATAGSPLTITATVTPYQNNGDSLAYDWLFTDPAEPTQPIAFSTSTPSLTYTPAHSGEWNVRLTVTDSAAVAPSVVDQSFFVADGTPLSIAGPALLNIGSAANFTILGDSSTELQWSVRLHASNYVTGSGANITFIPQDAGTYDLIASGQDTFGNPLTASTTLTVTRLSPTVTIGGLDTGYVGRALTLTANIGRESGNNDALLYQWMLFDANGSTYAFDAAEIPISNLGSYTIPGSLPAGKYTASVIVTNAADVTRKAEAKFDFTVLADPSDGHLTWGGLPIKTRADALGLSRFDTVAQQPDGKIVAVGEYYSAAPVESDTGDVRVARFNADLTLDTSFGPTHSGYIDLNLCSAFSNYDSETGSWGFRSRIHQIAIDPATQDIVVVGTARGGSNGCYLAATRIVGTARMGPDGRLLHPGMLDPTFHGGTPFLLNVNHSFTSGASVALLPDGSVLLGGQAGWSPTSETGSALAQQYGYTLDLSNQNAPDGLIPDFLLVKLQPNGTFDPSFGQNGVAAPTHVTGLPEDNSTTLYFGDVGGTYPQSDVGDAMVYGSGVEQLRVLSDGSVLAMGNLNRAVGLTAHGVDVGIGIARYTAAGAADTSFGDDSSGHSFFGTDVLNGAPFGYAAVGAARLQSSGQTLVAATGNALPNGTTHVLLLGVDSNGLLDNSYGQSGIVHSSTVPAFAVGPQDWDTFDLGYAYGSGNHTAYAFPTAAMDFQSDGTLITAMYTTAGDWSQGQTLCALIAIKTADGTLASDFGHGGGVDLEPAGLGMPDSTNSSLVLASSPGGLLVTDTGVLTVGNFGGPNGGWTVGDYGGSISAVVRYAAMNESAVVDLAAHAKNDSSIDLTWANAGFGQDGFVIERSTSRSGLDAAPEIIGTVGPTERDYTDSNLQADSRYYYRVVPFTHDATEATSRGVPSGRASAATLPTAGDPYCFQEALNVPINGDPVSTQTVLAAGVTYLVVASGVLRLGDDAAADAGHWFSTTDSKAYGETLGGQAVGIAIVDPAGGTGQVADWGDYDPATHRYMIAYTGNGTAIDFSLHGLDGIGGLGSDGARLQVQIYAISPSHVGSPEFLPSDAPHLQLTLPEANDDGALPVISSAESVNVLAAQDDGSDVPWELRLTTPGGTTSVVASGEHGAGTVTSGGVSAYSLDPASWSDGVYTLTLATTYPAQSNYEVTISVAIERPVMQIATQAPTLIGTAYVIDQNAPVKIIANAADGADVPWQLWLVSRDVAGRQILLADGTQSTGQGPDAARTVATINPAEYPNGKYRLELTSPGDGVPGTVLAERDIAVESLAKTGMLQYRQTDAQVPASVSPAGISRSYDSSLSDTHDTLPNFGNGWIFDAIDSHLQITGQADTWEPQQPTPVLRAGDLVSMTIPGDGRHVFEFDPIPLESSALYSGNPESILYQPRFVAVDGSGASLTFRHGEYENPYSFLAYSPRDNEFLAVSNGDWSHYWDNIPGTKVGFNPARPFFGYPDPITDGTDHDYEYELTTTAGMTYVIRAEDGRIKSTADASGNETFFNIADDGTVTATGPNGQNVFTAHVDNQRRITNVDIAGQESISYSYDASGNLVMVNGQRNSRTTYSYNDAHHPALLTGVTNTQGQTIMQAEYDLATGRLAALINAKGKRTPVDTSAVGANVASQTIVDAIGNVAVQMFDERYGTLLRKVQTVTDANGTTQYYKVSVTGYTYVRNDAADMTTRAPAGVSMLRSVQTYAPFIVGGTTRVALVIHKALTPTVGPGRSFTTRPTILMTRIVSR